MRAVRLTDSSRYFAPLQGRSDESNRIKMSIILPVSNIVWLNLNYCVVTIQLLVTGVCIIVLFAGQWAGSKNTRIRRQGVIEASRLSAAVSARLKITAVSDVTAARAQCNISRCSRGRAQRRQPGGLCPLGPAHGAGRAGRAPRQAWLSSRCICTVQRPTVVPAAVATAAHLPISHLVRVTSPAMNWRRRRLA